MPTTEERGEKGHRTKPHNHMEYMVYHNLPAMYCPHTTDVPVLSLISGVLNVVMCVFLHLWFPWGKCSEVAFPVMMSF